ncbi:Ger(x)C family spore germination protein [Lysinibacillus sp. NPDC097287]|uniref:Ger(x)C family spore germination protein n=1 Tax=Lysinibacillus sp. NPDC097287 TaxID=3364144 RepID=UPI003823CEC7
MNKKILLPLLLLVTLLSGCWDVSEPQRMYYIEGIGIDFKDGQYEVYMQIIDFTNIAKSEQRNPEAEQAEVGHAKGKTIDEAIFKIYRSIDQKVFWGHMTYLIFSEDALKKENPNQMIDSFLRHKDTRYTIWVYCTQDSIEDILLTTPIINKAITLSKLGNPLNSYEQESLIEPVNLRRLIIGLNEPSHEVSIPLIALNKDWKKSKETSEATEITGVGVISKNEFKGYIQGDQVHGIQWMSDETIRGDMTIELGEDDNNYLTITLKKIHVIIDPIVTNKDDVKFNINIKFDVTIDGIQGKITDQEIREAVINQVQKDIKSTYEEALKKDIDIYRLSEVLYRKNVKNWRKIETNGKIDLTEDSISNIEVNVNKINPGRKKFIETIEQ